MARINLRSVLAEIDTPDRSGQPRYFSIEYAKADGELGKKERVRKAGYAGGATRSEGSKFRYNVKKNGVLLVTDATGTQTRTLKIARLISYNGIRINHLDEK